MRSQPSTSHLYRHQPHWTITHILLSRTPQTPTSTTICHPCPMSKRHRVRPTDAHNLSARTRRTQCRACSSKLSSTCIQLLPCLGPFILKLCPFRKHYLNHAKPILCDFDTCPRSRRGKGFATKKDMEQHAWVAHPKRAAEKGYQRPEGQCDLCGQVLRRKDNLPRHKEKSCKGRPQ